MSERLTFDELRAYQAGQLSGSARYRVERVLLEDPFYADALAGLEAMQQAARPTPAQLASLSDALQDRIHASATKKRLWHLWIATIMAALLLVFAVAIYMIYFMPKKVVKPAPAILQTSLKTGSGAAPSPAATGESSHWQALSQRLVVGGRISPVHYQKRHLAQFINKPCGRKS